MWTERSGRTYVREFITRGKGFSGSTKELSGCFRIYSIREISSTLNRQSVLYARYVTSDGTKGDSSPDNGTPPPISKYY